MTSEVKVFANMKIEYFDAFEDFTLTQFSGFSDLYFKAINHDYGRITTAAYYKILGVGHLHNMKFVKEFFEKLE